MKKIDIYLAFLFITICISCKKKSPQLYGHYHLLWSKNYKGFQTWNIQNNYFCINQEWDTTCFAQIRFDKDTIHIEPWVDNTYSCNYKVFEDTIMMYNEYDTMFLIEHKNLLYNTHYIKEKTLAYTDTFSLPEEFTQGTDEYPKEYSNELFVGLSTSSANSDSVFYLFNDKLLKKEAKGKFGFEQTTSQELWLYIDKNVKLKYVIPLIKELTETNYKVKYASLIETENSELIRLLDRNMDKLVENESSYEINYCESCAYYPTVTGVSLAKIQINQKGEYYFNGQMLESAWEVARHLARYMGSDENTRKNTIVEISMDNQITFHDYITMVTSLDWHFDDLRYRTYYRGFNDSKAEQIENYQRNAWKNPAYYKVLANEFPMRIKEIINK